jgi:hypothetical protein
MKCPSQLFEAWTTPKKPRVKFFLTRKRSFIDFSEDRIVLTGSVTHKYWDACTSVL